MRHHSGGANSKVWAGEVTDVLNLGLTGVSIYSDWSGKTSNSDAVYAGNSGSYTTGGSSAISLRSSNSSGIIIPISGGKVKSVTVTWNSNTASGRTIDVYGKTTAYSATSDLYNASSSGTKIGSIVCGTSTSLVVTGDYDFIGIRSNNNTLYLDEIQITWENSVRSFTWDLSKDITVTATTTEMTWKGTSTTMAVAKGSASTATNTWYPGVGKTSTRFYTNSILAITPVAGYTITKIVFTATSTTYATALKESTWSNAAAAVDGSIVTVTPTDGTAAVSATIGVVCGFTAVQVNYNMLASTTITLASACNDGAVTPTYYGTYSIGRAFVVPSDLTVSEINIVDGKLSLSDYSTGEVVPANTGVMIASNTAGDHTISFSKGGTSKLGSDNMLKPSGDAGIAATDMNVASTKFYRLTMHNAHSNPPGEIGFWWGAAEGAAFKVAANKAYLAVPTGAGAPEFFWFGDNSTSISEVRSNMEDVKGNVYDLQGRKVANPTKGLYIVNGKKYMVK